MAVPSAGQRRKLSALFKLHGNQRQAFSAVVLAFKQRVQDLLPVGAGCFCLLFKRLLRVECLRQAAEGGVF